MLKSAYNETVLEVRYVSILVPTGPIWVLFFSSYGFLSYLLKICDAPIRCGGRRILRKGTSPIAQPVKESACNEETQEMWVQSLGWEDPLEKEMATQSSILAWRISWTEQPGAAVHGVTKS